MKKLSELEKQGKIDLLRAIKAGEIDPTSLKPTDIIVSNGKEMFLGLMMQASTSIEGEASNIVFIGPAKKELDNFMSQFKPQIQ